MIKKNVCIFIFLFILSLSQIFTASCSDVNSSGGIDISGQSNVIIRNLRVTMVGISNPHSVNGGNAISIHGSSRNIWIDHCELFSEDPDVQTDIDLNDGLIDIKNDSGFITISCATCMITAKRAS